MVKAWGFEWFLRYKDLKNWLGLGIPPGQPLRLGFQISNFVAKLCINIYHIKISKQPSVVHKNGLVKNLGCFGHARGPALESNISNFKTL